MSEFVTKIANALQELVKYSVISKIQTGDRTFDNLLSAAILIVITHVISPTFFGDIYHNFHVYIVKLHAIILKLFSMLGWIKILFPEKILHNMEKYTPTVIIKLFNTLSRVVSNMSDPGEVVYLPGTSYQRVTVDNMDWYLNKYFDVKKYNPITWYTTQSVEFNNNLVEYLYNELPFIIVTSRALKFSETSITNDQKLQLSMFTTYVTDKKYVPIFIYKNELIVLTYTPGGFYINYKSYSTLEVFWKYIMSYKKESDLMKNLNKKRKAKASESSNNVYKIVIQGDIISHMDYGVIYEDRNFDNYVSRHKPKIKALVDNFLQINETGTSKFGQFGSFNLGLMLYGKPGCGKTLLAKVIANYTERDIYIVDMSKVKTRQSFENIFANNIGDKVYVFDEFDCVQGILSREDNMRNSVLEKQEKKVNQERFLLTKQKIDYIASLKDIKDSEQKERIQKEIQNIEAQLTHLNDDLTLDTILTVIDGVREMRNRIIIANTNHIDRIDSALLREGRFDMKLHMTEFNDDEIKELLCLMYKEEADKHHIMSCKFQEDTFTPTAVMNICHKYEDLKIVTRILEGDNTAI